MPVLPLIVTMLIASIAGSSDTRQIGTLGARTLVVMLALLTFFAVIMMPLAKVLLGGLTFDPASTASLREAARFDPALLQQVSLREWLLSLVPNNPIRAAADGAELGDVAAAARLLREKTLVGGRIAPGAVRSGFVYFPLGAYDRARLLMIDVATGEAEGFAVDF